MMRLPEKHEHYICINVSAQQLHKSYNAAFYSNYTTIINTSHRH